MGRDGDRMGKGKGDREAERRLRKKQPGREEGPLSAPAPGFVRTPGQLGVPALTVS